MKVTVQFYSWFKELAQSSVQELEISKGSTVGDLLEQVYGQYPKLREVKKSTLIAVGVEYASLEQELHEGDEISFFPPVQGG
ncbi:MAG: MoaD/ThiS family protein [Verrucomicrobiota bacterium]|nr:MoaD/ThiS family protein [Verrucomicrobiota bacterium]